MTPPPLQLFLPRHQLEGDPRVVVVVVVVVAVVFVLLLLYSLEFFRRWCDAYHAIKYLKDHGYVTTSRGAKGTSIKDDHHTIDSILYSLQSTHSHSPPSPHSSSSSPSPSPQRGYRRPPTSIAVHDADVVADNDDYYDQQGQAIIDPNSTVCCHSFPFHLLTFI